jgi:hypothetical protein
MAIRPRLPRCCGRGWDHGRPVGSLRSKRQPREGDAYPAGPSQDKGLEVRAAMPGPGHEEALDRGELVTAGALIAFYSSADWAEELAAAVRRNARQARGEVARYDDVTVVYLTNAKRETIENCVESDNDPPRLYCFRLARTKRRPQPERGGRCPDVSCSGRVSSAPARVSTRRRGWRAAPCAVGLPPGGRGRPI